MISFFLRSLCVYGLFIKCSSNEDVTEIKNKITAMKNQASVLEKENNELELKIAAVKEQCAADLGPLKDQQVAMHEKYKEEGLLLVQIIQNITRKQQEETVLLRNIHREHVIESKYALQIELYGQELELYNGRRQQKIAEKCNSLRPLFKKYEATISIRTFGGGFRKKRSEKDYILVLNTEYEQFTIAVQRLLSKNQELKSEIGSEEKLCQMEKSDLEQILKATDEKVKNAIENRQEYQQELKEIIENLQVKTKYLKHLKEKNQLLKMQSLELKKKVDLFTPDLECYRQLFTLNINYQ